MSLQNDYSFSKIGNHEIIYPRIGEFTQGKSYTVDNIMTETVPPNIETKTGVRNLSSGSIIGANALIKCNGSFVEVVSSDFNIRLKPGSEFCLENTLREIAPVVYGSVYIKKITNNYRCDYKYRTSCWGIMQQDDDVIVEAFDANSDIYYALNNEVNIYEFDESGKKFLIMHLEPFQMGTLSFKLSEPMRSRYKVCDIQTEARKTIQRLYKEYVMPFNWKNEEI